MFASDGTFIRATIDVLGSWHGSAVARALFQKLIHETLNGYYIIADTVFPHNAPALDGKIKTPPETGYTRYPNNPIGELHFELFSEKLVSARQAAGWGMRCLQGSFGRLLPRFNCSITPQGIVLVAYNEL